ncbi:MAG: hypothetical protein JSR72_04120 [Proteobacteria bacterium]|nr:hypothetical protein [Pseudomonadota bacterium]
MTTLYRLIVPGLLLAVALAGVFVVVDTLGRNERAAERRALIARSDDLTARALSANSALSCLDAAAGDATETACEAAVFASPQATAAAVAYIGARLDLLADARDRPELASRLAGTRRAIELDRYGVAAHVLSERDGCTAVQCPAFALVSDANMLKSNIKAQTFDQYVSRHAAAWNAPAAAQPAAPAVSQAVPPVALPQTASAQPPAEARPVSSKYDFPSAASIPPVSIMNSEPPLSKEAAAAKAEALVQAAPGDKTPPLPLDPAKTPVPPKRPQAANEPADIAPAR